MAVSALQSPPLRHSAELSTGFEAFEQCFAQTQDQEGRPWAFVPSPSGGTFTNIGASGGGSPYRLLVRAGNSGTSIRLLTGAPGAELVAAVEKCR